MVSDLSCTSAILHDGGRLAAPLIPDALSQAHLAIAGPLTSKHCAMQAGSGPPEVATGGRDGAVRVWDTRQHDAPVAAFLPEAASKVEFLTAHT